MDKSRIKDRVVLVTGASTGIGLALVKALKNTEFKTIATARRDSLKRFAEEEIYESDRLKILPLDIASEQERAKIIDEANSQWGGVDILVNNAGISYRAVIEHTRPEDEQAQFAVNYFGPLRLTRLVLDGMRRKRQGHIINISSVGGIMAMPTMGNYNASKFALEGASEALWYELRPWGIYVSLVQPGFVRSQAYKNVLYSESSQASMLDANEPYHAYYKYMGKFISKMMEHAPSTPDKIARKIIKIMRRPSRRLRLPATLDAWGFHLLRRILPRRVYHYVLYRFLPRIDEWAPPPSNSDASTDLKDPIRTSADVIDAQPD